MKSALLDTDILINWIRGEKWEKELLRSGWEFYYSTVSRKELFRFKKIDAREKKKIIYLLNCFKEIFLTPAIAEKSSLLISKYSSRRLCPPDAVIAATAWDKNLCLITKNQKHFSFITEIAPLFRVKIE